MKTETPSLSFIAGDIAAKYGSEFELDRRELANAIEAALNARDERAAKIVSDARFEGNVDLRELASRIRGWS